MIYSEAVAADVTLNPYEYLVKDCNGPGRGNTLLKITAMQETGSRIGFFQANEKQMEQRIWQTT